MKTIIVGIGNPLLGDDGVGIHIVRTFQKTHIVPDEVVFDEAQTGGMNLLDVIRGYEQVILVDAVSLSHLSHGQVIRFRVDELPTVHSNNPHDASFMEALQLARAIGDQDVTNDITIIGINLQHIPRDFCDCLSEEIKGSIPKAVDMINSELKNRGISIKNKG